MDGADLGPSASRLRIVGGLMLFGLAGAWLQVFHLQVQEHDHLAKLAQEQYVSHVKIPARRGHIYDQSGAPMAITVDVPSVSANPAVLGDLQEAAKKLAGPLGTTPTLLAQKLASGRYFVWLRRHVSPQMAEAIRSLNLPGVGITEEPRRSYPNGTVAAQVIGVAGLDGHGLEGIERQLDAELVGTPQLVPAWRDARGQSVLGGGQEHDLLSRGSDVTLSLDVQVQHRAEQALAQALAATGAKAATAVVMDVATAEILALASLPLFDPSNGANAQQDARRNRALTDLVEPGSTLKPMVVAAALDRNVLAPRTRIFCEQGRYPLRGHTINDTHPHGWLTPTDILAKSSNIGMAKIAVLLGKERLDAALRDFGLGQRSQVGFVGEVPGLLRPVAGWTELDTASIAFGQGVAVNLLQLASAYRVLAADGIYRQPRLVRSVRRPDGRQAALPEAPERRVLGVEAARRVTRMLEQAIAPEGGTGRLAAVAGYRVAGKTGTAQKADMARRGYSRDKYTALFGGYLPAEAPRVVIVVAIDEPRTNHYGGVVAAPVFAQIGAAAMQRLGVVASSHAEVAQTPVTAEEAAAMRVEPMSMEAPVDAVPSLARKGSQQDEDNADLLPSFVGLTSRQATEQFIHLRVAGVLTLSGHGKVVRQDPAPQSSISAGGGLHLVLAPQEPS